jgi:hypothetical protein
MFVATWACLRKTAYATKTAAEKRLQQCQRRWPDERLRVYRCVLDSSHFHIARRRQRRGS